jgi:hypothetical protein
MISNNKNSHKCPSLYCVMKRLLEFDMFCTAVHQGLSKYLAVQDTHISPTSTNQSRTLSSHGNLLSLQSQSTIQEHKTFSVLVLSKLIQKLVIALSWSN